MFFLGTGGSSPSSLSPIASKMHVRQKCCQRFTPRAISLSLNFNRNGIIYEEYRRHEFSLSSALHPLRRHAKGNGSMAFPVGRLHGSWLLRLPLSNPPRSTSSPGELPGLRSLLSPTTRGFRATRTVIGGLRISGKRFHFLFLFDHNPPRDALELIIQGAEQEEQRTGEQSSMTDRDRQTEDSRPSWSSNDVRRNSNNRGLDEEVVHPLARPTQIISPHIAKYIQLSVVLYISDIYSHSFL